MIAQSAIIVALLTRRVGNHEFRFLFREKRRTLLIFSSIPLSLLVQIPGYRDLYQQQGGKISCKRTIFGEAFKVYLFKSFEKLPVKEKKAYPV